MDNREVSRPLVEAPMESPLNLAHMFSRRADMLAKNRKYEEAINCHRKAAECLLQSMKTASCPTLLESMALQHKAYLSQIDRLHAKSQLLELLGRNDKTTVTISRATQTDGMHSVEANKEQALDEELVYQTLRENDALLNRVCLKSFEKTEFSKDPSSKTCVGNYSDTDKNNETLNVVKPDGVIQGLGSVSVDELVKMNEKLSQAVCGLLQELEVMKAEKKQIEEKLGDSQEVLKTGSEALKFSSLDLPPLEVSFPELANLNMQT